MEKEQFAELTKLFHSHNPPSIIGRPPITAPVQCAIGMLILGHGSALSLAATTFEICKASAHRIFKRFVQFVNTHLPKITMPTAAEAETNALKFAILAARHMRAAPVRMPKFFGAIDGCHIRVVPPEELRGHYYNRKDFPSILLQGLVSPDCRFLDAFVGSPGRLHDANNYDLSEVEELIPKGHVVLADAAYTMNWTVLTPYYGHMLSEEQERFNHLQSSLRIVVERSFGVLKKRFQILSGRMAFNDLLFASQVTHACCVLHNYVTPDRDDWPTDLRACLPDNFEFIPAAPRNNSASEKRGAVIRDRMASAMLLSAESADEPNVA